MTTLYISHGAPTLALEPGATGQALSQLAHSLPRPKSILVISAHWDTRFVKVSTAIQPETIHDFGGFPRAMYDINYPVSGAPEVAGRAADLLAESGVLVQKDAFRGLDHGAWVPLMLMYPEADIPVTQLSIQTHLGSAAHFAMGQAISALQDEGVMILCSGAITHNLHDFFTTTRDAPVLNYVTDFTDWVAQKIENNEMEALVDYREQSQSGIRAHPSEDHILPLFVALGAGRGKPTRIQPENTFGILAMDIYCWD